jgi:hypothetical protein
LQTTPVCAEPVRLAQAFLPDALPPREVLALVRAEGLVPISPPLRAGRIYALRAVDPHGEPLRVIVDARWGEIVSVQRLAPAELVGPRSGSTPGASRPDLDGPRSFADDLDDQVEPAPPRTNRGGRQRAGESSPRAAGPNRSAATQKLPDLAKSDHPAAARAQVNAGKAKNENKADGFPPVTPLE